MNFYKKLIVTLLLVAICSIIYTLKVEQINKHNENLQKIDNTLFLVQYDKNANLCSIKEYNTSMDYFIVNHCYLNNANNKYKWFVFDSKNNLLHSNFTIK